MRQIVLSKQANKALIRMPARQSVAILSQLDRLASDPRDPRCDVRTLTGKPGLRLRVGDWRVLFAVEDDVLFVNWIGPRGDAY